MADRRRIGARRVTVGLAVAAAAAGCADILGLQDPAGSLDEGGPATSTGAPTTGTGTGAGSPVTGTTTSGGGGDGAGGGGTSTGGGAGSTTSTGGGGGSPASDVTELPEGLSIEALGRSPGGAVALVKQASTVNADLCSTSLPTSGLTAVAIDVSSPCAVLGQVSVANQPELLAGHSIGQRGDWVAVSGRGGEGTLTLSVGDDDNHVADLDTGAGFFGVWHITAPEQGYVEASNHAISAGAALPLDDGAADVVYVSTTKGVGSCTAGKPGVNRTHFGRPRLDGTCIEPRLSVDGFMLDAAQENDSWVLLEHEGSCSALAISGGAVREAGECAGPVHLLVAADAGDDLTFAGAGNVEECEFKPGIIEASGALPTDIWCEPDEQDEQDERVIPFHLDTTHLHFLRSDGTAASRWAVARAGGDGVEVAGLCTGCIVEDAVASNGSLFVIGFADVVGGVVLGEPVEGGRWFWARVPLAEL